MTDDPNLCDHWRVDKLLDYVDREQWDRGRARLLLVHDPLLGLEASLRKAVGEYNCARHDDLYDSWMMIAQEIREAHVATWAEALHWIEEIRRAWRRKLPGRIYELRIRLFRAALQRVDAVVAPAPKVLARWQERSRMGALRAEERALRLRLRACEKAVRRLAGLVGVGVATVQDAQAALAVLEGPQDPSEPAQSAAGGGPVG